MGTSCSNGGIRPGFLIPLAALAAALAAPSAAHGAVTIGSTLAGAGADNLGGYCIAGGTCTGVNLALPSAATAPNGLVSPLDGVVVRWRVKSGSAGNPVSLRVLRPAGGTSFAGAGTSTPGTTVAGVAETPSRVRIRSGDGVGLNIGNSALVWALTPGATGVVWGSVNGFPGGLADGQTAQGDGQAQRELLVQAVVEPDRDADGFGDETQDGCPGDPGRQTPPCAVGAVNPAGRPPPPVAGELLVTGARVIPARFRVGSLARIRFRLSRAARYRLAFDRIVPGRRRGRRCVPRVPGSATRRPCSAYVRRGTRSGPGRAGVNRLAFRGRLRGVALRRGRYRVTIGAEDAAGNAARSRTARFTLVR